MDGRSFTLIIAILLGGSALTGCIQNPDWFTTSASEVSAFKNKGLADGAASSWSASATLVGVMAFELSQTPDPRIDSDPDPGNGLAPAWWYVYVDEKDEGPQVRAFKVTSDGNVTSEKDAEAFAMGVDHDSVVPIKNWSVDSDAALATAKTNATFAKVVQGFNASVVEGVAQEADTSVGPAWWFSAMSADGFVVATVDAVTGTLLEVTTLDADMVVPTFEWAATPGMAGVPVHMEGEGSAAAGNDPEEFAFSVTGPLSGTIQFSFESSLPSDGMHWAILDEEGEVVAEEHIASWRGTEGESEADIDIPDAGEYTLLVSYMSSFEPGFLPATPLSGSIRYTFVLDLMPGMSGAVSTQPR